MRVFIENDYEKMSLRAAEIVKQQIQKKHNTILGLATGSTPIGMYNYLISMYQRQEVDFSDVVTFNLDEYVGLSRDNKNSYNYFMYSKFFNYINIKKENIHIPNGVSKDLEKECSDYEYNIEKFGYIDLQVLGIGENGHIGFNEPAELLETRTHVAKLSEDTIKANKRFFESIDDVPLYAISMGIGSIMKSKRIILLASGENKAKAIKETLSNKLTTKIPATVLALHPNVDIIIDKDAAKLLNT
ncbi:MAG: glucosamine-6-phosphate deaminase [Thermoanaerobacteraceae bacterium]